jgi:hypothetical protein
LSARRSWRIAIAPAVIWLLPAPPATAACVERLSDQQTVTYWAYAVTDAHVRAAPRFRARKVDALRLWTEDGYPEVYLVRAQCVRRDLTWFEVGLPGRPNGRTGWVTEQALGPLHVVHTHLVVDTRRLRLTLYRRSRRIFTAAIGVGTQLTPTPRGNFWIREKFAAQGGLYGPYAIGTSDYSVLTDWPGGGIVGIHGTDQPWLIPGRPSHGCIRLKNADVTRLYRLLPVGTPMAVI